MVDKEVTNQVGWLESIKERLNLDAIMEQLRLSKDKLIEVALYSGIGFLSGFFVEKIQLVCLCLGISSGKPRSIAPI